MRASNDTRGQAAVDFHFLPYVILAALVIAAWEMAKDVGAWVASTTVDEAIAGLAAWATTPQFSPVDIVGGVIPVLAVLLVAAMLVYAPIRRT